MDRRKKNIVELTRTTPEEYAAAPKLPLTLLMDNVRSMQNVGSLLRTCDAFAVEEAVMAGITGVPPHPEISKSALGAEETVKWRHVDDAAAEVRRLKAEGVCVCVLEQTHGSIPLQDFRPSPQERWLLVVGNEVEGVSQRLADAADTVVEIPQAGTKHSLNVAVCAGILLWHFYLHLRLT